MDDIVFYHPPSASRSQSRFAGTATASRLPLGSIASLPARQTATPVSTLSQKTHTLDRYCRNDKQETFTASRNLPNRSDDDDDFPDIEELLSGTWKESMLASAGLNGDDDGFIDTDELLSGRQQRGPTSVDPDYGGMADMVDNGTRGGSPTSSSRSTVGSSRDPIILSDDESPSAESDTDCSDLDLDVRVKSDPHPLHVANSELRDREGFRSGSGAAFNSDCLATDYNVDDNNHNGLIHTTPLNLSAGHPSSSTLKPGSDTRQASNLRMNSDITQDESTSYDNRDANKELQGGDLDVFVEGGDVDSSIEGRMLSAASDRIPASGTNISELQDGQPDDAQSSQLLLAAASPYQSDLDNEDMSKQGRRSPSKNDHRKRRRTHEATPTRRATTASAASATPESPEVKGQGRNPSVQIMAPQEDWERCDTDRETVDSGSADDSEDEDYSDTSDAARPRRGSRRHSRKRFRRMKDTARNDVKENPPHLVNSLCESAATTPSSSTEESEEMPVHGFLKLRTVGSKVVYCLTFSQDWLPLSQHQDQKRVQPATSRVGRKRIPWTTEENRKIVKMKKQGCSWHEIHGALPNRTPGAIQVQYSTKLKKK